MTIELSGSDEPKRRTSVNRWPLVLVAVLAPAASIGGTVAVGQWRDDAMERRMSAIEARTAADHDAVTEIRQDVKWIRETMARNGS